MGLLSSLLVLVVVVVVVVGFRGVPSRAWGCSLRGMNMRGRHDG